MRTSTPSGLHEFVTERVLSRYGCQGVRAVDLGCGPGAIASRLQSLGCDVVAVDISAEGYEAAAPHVVLDLNQTDFALKLGLGNFELATAIEVIEHVESPIGFLRNLCGLLSPSGVAVITTPNVESLAARLKFFVSGRIRAMDERSDPTHISPVFMDLLERQFLSRSGLKVLERFAFPENGFQLSRRSIALVLRVAAFAFPSEYILGDHHVIVLERIR